MIIRNLLSEMADNRKIVIGHIEGLAKPFCEHIIKCCIYKNATGDLKHWINDEICGYLEKINKMEVKTPSGRLKSNVYKEYLESILGENINDAEIGVFVFKELNKTKAKPYPDFEYTDEDINRIHNIHKQIIDYFCPIFAKSNNKLTDYEITEKVNNIFRENGIKA